MTYRTERDTLGEIRVPKSAYYGAQTARAVENFQISGMTAAPELITATVLVKKAAAQANRSLRRLPATTARAIVEAADEILDGGLRDQFVVDVYQAGAGTSHNMNANEVIANRAAEILGGRRGEYARVHPNDDVNMGQSTNDVFPTATRLAILLMLPALRDAAGELAAGLSQKGRAFAGVLKTGRTHLQDAVPITLGQEFGGYAANIVQAAGELDRTATSLHELNLGASAVGTGVNAGDDYARLAIANLARATRLPLRPAANRFRVTQSMGDVLAYSGALRRLSVEVSKIASDLRLLSMGPRAGLAEITLPAVQPGSSIMPGKVNPSVPEAVNQVCHQVTGCDATVHAAADAGQLELNVMMPVMAWNVLHATRILGRAMATLQRRCVAGIDADAKRCRELLDRSTAVATALSPYIGYAATAELATASVATGRPIRELVRERGLLDDAALDTILSPEAMTTPGIPGKAGTRASSAPITPTASTPRRTPDKGGVTRENPSVRNRGARRARDTSRARPAAGAAPTAAAARAAVPAGKPRSSGRPRPRPLAAPRSGDGRAPDRRRQRRR